MQAVNDAQIQVNRAGLLPPPPASQIRNTVLSTEMAITPNQISKGLLPHPQGFAQSTLPMATNSGARNWQPQPQPHPPMQVTWDLESTLCLHNADGCTIL